MSDTRILSRGPFETLAHENQILRDLIEEYQDLDTMEVFEKEDLLRRIKREIAAHVALQEQIVYPVLLELNDTDITASIAERRLEHQSIYQLLMDLNEAGTPLLHDLAIIRLRFNTLRHLKAEEEEIHPIASRLTRGTLNRLETAMEDRDYGHLEDR